MSSTIAPRTFRVLTLVGILTALQGVLDHQTLQAQSSAPLAPVNFVIDQAGTFVSLQWAANAQGSAASGFQVHVGSQPGASDLLVIGLAASQTVFQADAPPGVYFVRILAVNAAGVSAPSEERLLTVALPGCVPPQPPQNVVPTPTSTGVTITWSAPTSGGAPTGYVIDVGSAPGQSNLGSFPLPNATTLTAPAPPGQFFIRIRAVNACGTSLPSAERPFVVSGASSAAPLAAGVYNGVMSNNTRPGLGRPPISAFQLILNQAMPSSGFGQLSARWADNAGCVRTTNIFGGTGSGRVSLSVESLLCNDGDMILRIESIVGNVVSGTCNGGTACRFQMTRQ